MWRVAFYYEMDADQISGNSYACHGGFLVGIALFDSCLFDVSPADAAGIDFPPCTILDVSCQDLLAAGWTKQQLLMRLVNIVAGVGRGEIERSLMPEDIAEGFGVSSSANANAFLCLHCCLTSKGAGMIIATACSALPVCIYMGRLHRLHSGYGVREATVVCGASLITIPCTDVGGGEGMRSHIGRGSTNNFSTDVHMRKEATAVGGIKLKTFKPGEGDYDLSGGSQANQVGGRASLMARNVPCQERCRCAGVTETKCKPCAIDIAERYEMDTWLGDLLELRVYWKVVIEGLRAEPVINAFTNSTLGHCEWSVGGSGFTQRVHLSKYRGVNTAVHLNSLSCYLDRMGSRASS